MSEFGPELFEAFFQRLELVGDYQGRLVFLAESDAARDWLRRHGLRRLEARMRAHMILEGEIEVHTLDTAPAPVRDYVADRAPAARRAEREQPALPPPPHPGFTFETFCVDETNHRAVTLLQLVASGAPTNFPLVLLHSPPGCGKTHLLHACAYAAQCAVPERKVRYMMAQEFIEEFQYALHKKKDSSEFKQRVREPDIFFLDDVHRIAGRKVTEEEFLDTVIMLNSRGRQVVITADQGPDGIGGFDDRLRHHLSGAAVCEITEPGEALRRRILEAKVRHYQATTPGFRVAPAALDMIARRMSGSGRLLDGAVSQLVVEARVSGLEEVTLEAAENALRGKMMDRAEIKPVRVATVLKVVARHNNMTVEQLLTRSRQRAFAQPRQIAAYLCTQLTHASLPDIGRRFGGFDHSTILYSRNKIRAALETDPRIRSEVDTLTRLIQKEPSAGTA
ncbi:MAG: AAA family ATPase [Hydrogenophilaceae bacterium]|jgi:chromosomal replication initiator protein|nr:AAA family ATPase [Hydrogenophilaceae bacterium]